MAAFPACIVFLRLDCGSCAGYANAKEFLTVYKLSYPIDFI